MSAEMFEITKIQVNIERAIELMIMLLVIVVIIVYSVVAAGVDLQTLLLKPITSIRKCSTIMLPTYPNLILIARDILWYVRLLHAARLRTEYAIWRSTLAYEVMRLIPAI